MRSLYFFLTFVVFLPSAFAQNVTFSTSGGPARRVLAELSAAAGTRLEASPQTADDVLVLSVKAMPLPELMKKIASVAGAEWETFSGGYRLVRPNGLRRTQELDDQKARAEALKQSLARMTAEIDRETFDRTVAAKIAQDALLRSQAEAAKKEGLIYGAIDGFDARSPAARALVPIFSLIGAEKLATIRPNTRVLFSTNANAMQVEFPAAANPIVQRFVAEQTVLNDIRKQNTPAGSEVRSQNYMDWISGGDPNRISKVLLVVTRQSAIPSLLATLVVVDTKGQSVAHGSLALTPAAEPGATFSAGEGEASLRFPPEDKLFASAIIAAGHNPWLPSQDGTPQALPAMLRQKLLNPDKEEPLALGATQALQTVAEARGKQLVARLPDESLLAISRLIVGPETTPSKFLEDLSRRGLAVSEGDGVLEVRPRRFSESEMRRVNRRALGTFLRSQEKNGFAGFADLATYAVAQPKAPRAGELDYAYARLLDPGATGGVLDRVSFTHEWRLLQFAGLMTPELWKVVSAGKPVTMPQFSPQQRAVLNDMVFNGLGGETVAVEGIGADEGVSLPGNSFPGVDPMRDYTMLLPRGIPETAVLRLSIGKSAAAIAYPRAGGRSRLMSQGDMGSMLKAADEGYPGGPDYLYRPGYEAMYEFDFTLAPEVRHVPITTIFGADGPVATYAYGDLPAAFRDGVEKARRRTFGRSRSTGPDVPPPQG